MLSGFRDFFTGGSSKRYSYEDHIEPVQGQRNRSLNHTDCCHWMNKRVVLQLKRFERPQLGTVKYVGSDTRGAVCAGIEFDYDIGGMSGKVSGQSLFKCKQHHGLLVPVQFVTLLEDYENGTSIFPIVPRNNFSSSAAPNSMNRAQSVPNLSNRSGENVAFAEYVPQSLPGLKIGDNVVWLGGTDPQTGIVRWIGRAGRIEQIPIKAWIEMDQFTGHGRGEMDMGSRFGCVVGRGKLLPVDELILIENFIPEVGTGQEVDVPQVLPEFIPPSQLIPENTVINLDLDLIDFDLERSEDSGKSAVVDPISNEPLNSEVLLTEPVFRVEVPPLSKDLHEEIFKEFCPMTIVDTVVLPKDEVKTDESGLEINTSTSEPNKESIAIELGAEDVNGNLDPCQEIGNDALKSVDLEVDYLPPFLIPPISIVDFFKATGMKGIQGRRNSCYMDVVLFSLFAFTDTFDPYFLVKTCYFAKGPDSERTRLAKKALSEQIVNPLRQNYYCPANGLNFLRELMIPVSNKMDGGFMDIEEFMLILFDKIFNLKEFIMYDNGTKDYLHQINLGDHILPVVMTVKQCLELSMKDYKLRFKDIPSPALIIEIPRNTYGIIQSTIMIPNLSLNLENVMQCEGGQGLNPTRGSSTMDLLAVICINDFHFVTFVKCGTGRLSHWILFDSNPSEERPKVEIVPNMGEWLESLEHSCNTNPPAEAFHKHKVPPMVQRLLSDIYVCIYCPAYV